MDTVRFTPSSGVILNQYRKCCHTGRCADHRCQNDLHVWLHENGSQRALGGQARGLRQLRHPHAQTWELRSGSFDLARVGWQQFDSQPLAGIVRFKTVERTCQRRCGKQVASTDLLGANLGAGGASDCAELARCVSKIRWAVAAIAHRETAAIAPKNRTRDVAGIGTRSTPGTVGVPMMFSWFLNSFHVYSICKAETDHREKNFLRRLI